MISGRVPTLLIMHTNGDFIVLPQWEGVQSTSNHHDLIYSTQSHYPYTEPTCPCPILTMPSAWLGSDKHQFLRHWFDSTRSSNPMMYYYNRRWMHNSFGQALVSHTINNNPHSTSKTLTHPPPSSTPTLDGDYSMGVCYISK